MQELVTLVLIHYSISRSLELGGTLVFGWSNYLQIKWEAQVVDWSVMRLIPFSYVHYTIPISELPIIPLFGLAGTAALLTGLGLIGFSRRSIG